MRAAALAALVLAVAGCTLGVDQSGGRDGAINQLRVPLTAAPARQPAPPVAGETLDGEPLDLADYGGELVLLNFWGSWCGPCAREVPDLVAVAENYAPDVSVVGVNVRDSLTNARSFERDLGVTYPSLYDATAEIAGAFGGIAPEAMPSTIIIDRDGLIAVRLFGAVTRSRLTGYLDDLLAEA